MVNVSNVNSFINENILHSNVWDNASEVQKSKAVNQSIRTLEKYFKDRYKGEVPVDHVAEQCIWILKIDDMFQRAELGATQISIDGISISFQQIDRTICPYILDCFNLPPTWNIKRKVGGYATTIHDSFRKGW